MENVQQVQFAPEPEDSKKLAYISIGVIVLLIAGAILMQIYLPSKYADSRSMGEIAAIDSGVTLEVRKQAILDLVAQGPGGVTSAEKAMIASSLQGQQVQAFNFTPEEIERIYTVINN